MPLIKRSRSREGYSDYEDDSPVRVLAARRVSVACTECRTRKSKCDGGETCSNCFKNPGRACEYRNVTPEENQAARRRKHYPDSSSSHCKKMKRAWSSRASRSDSAGEDIEELDDDGDDWEYSAPKGSRRPSHAPQRPRPTRSSSSGSARLVECPDALSAVGAPHYESLHRNDLHTTPLSSPGRSLSIVIPPLTAPRIAPYLRGAESLGDHDPSHSDVAYQPYLSPTHFLPSPQSFVPSQLPPSLPPTAYHLHLPPPEPVQDRSMFVAMPTPRSYLPFPTPAYSSTSTSCSPTDALPFPTFSQSSPHFVPYYPYAPSQLSHPQQEAWDTSTTIHDAAHVPSVAEPLAPLVYDSPPHQLHTPRSNPCSPVIDSLTYCPSDRPLAHLEGKFERNELEDGCWTLDGPIEQYDTPYKVRYSSEMSGLWT